MSSAMEDYDGGSFATSSRGRGSLKRGMEAGQVRLQRRRINAEMARPGTHGKNTQKIHWII